MIIDRKWLDKNMIANEAKIIIEKFKETDSILLAKKMYSNGNFSLANAFIPCLLSIDNNIKYCFYSSKLKIVDDKKNGINCSVEEEIIKITKILSKSFDDEKVAYKKRVNRAELLISKLGNKSPAISWTFLATQHNFWSINCAIIAGCAIGENNMKKLIKYGIKLMEKQND